MDKSFPEYKDHTSQFYKNLNKLFVIIGYGSFRSNIKRELITSINTDVCPYCNATYIRYHRLNGKIKGELDHFHPKDIYPFLAISKYNLVPSCSYCNGIYGKHTKDSYKIHLVNPHTLSSSQGIIFRADLKVCALTSLKDLEENININVTSPDARLDVNKRIFNLEQIYQSHNNIAAEVYKKLKFFHSLTYFKSILNLFHIQSNFIENDAMRLLTGYYMSEKDFGKRPLSKFVYDLYMYNWNLI